ncbi:MAG: hypothetical protein LAP13_00520 [Acidobacteriia bacterium]|nr:hypothetical protein [Terriglobia bacterium]
MKLESEKELRLVGQVAVATLLACWGFPVISLILIALILPWRPIYRVAGYLGEVVLEIKARNTVKRALRKLGEEPLSVTWPRG